MTSATGNYVIASDMAAQLQQCVRNIVVQVQVDGKNVAGRGEGVGQKKSQTAAVSEVWPWACAKKLGCRFYSCTAGLPCTGREPLRIK